MSMILRDATGHRACRQPLSAWRPPARADELLFRGTLGLSQRVCGGVHALQPRQEVAMERVKDQPSRGPLGTLGSMLAGGGQALIVLAQSLADDVQRRIADVMPPAWRSELDGLAHRIMRLENVLADGGREIVGPVRALALNAIEGTAT